MIIQLPEWDGWRIEGTNLDWQIQQRTTNKGAEQWNATNYYSAIEYAIGYAYERTLRESGRKLTERNEWMDECERVKDALLKAVKKAVRA